MGIYDSKWLTINLLGLLFYFIKIGRGYHRELIDDMEQERTELEAILLEQERRLNAI